jgi:hypothetical protein
MRKGRFLLLWTEDNFEVQAEHTNYRRAKNEAHELRDRNVEVTLVRLDADGNELAYEFFDGTDNLVMVTAFGRPRPQRD